MWKWVGTIVLVGWALGVSAQMSKAESKVRKALADGKAYKAIRACDHELTDENAPPVFLLLRAQAYNDVVEFEKALRDCERYIREHEGYYDAYQQAGIALMGLGRIDSAKTCFERVVAAVDPGTTYVMDRATLTEAHFRLSAIALRQGSQEKAMQHLTAARKTASDDEVPKWYRLSGELYAQMNDSAQARKMFDEAIALRPRDPVNYNSRAFYRYALFGEHQKALVDYDHAIGLNPNYSYAHNNRGWSYYKLGDKEKALKDIRLAARKKVHNPYVYRNMGVIALEGGDVDAACEQFGKALAENFTALFGTEVEDLMKANCASKRVTTSPTNAPAPSKVPPPANAPGGTVPKSNAP